ncbi:hypothetical protein GOBAR_AA19328 [Gossypium barbadense]|uniref:Uncharacterized protein n=1 Tax=Gossypium barbadense TaxID=3634 RepID=A0A2P5XDD0_GOSBA|nr:hypothetical protein GOBAR_AA19328 [Gossypium barbadense]
MIALYYLPRNVEPDKLFSELANVELVQNVTPLNQQYRVQDPYNEFFRVFIDRIVRLWSDIDMGWESAQYGEEGSDLGLAQVLDDIDDEGIDDDDNVYVPSLKNPTRGIVIYNNPEAHILSVYSWI